MNELAEFAPQAVPRHRPAKARHQTAAPTRPVRRRNTPLAAVAADKAAVAKATSRLGCTKGGGKPVGFNASV
jgi:hypothetical protein